MPFTRGNIQKTGFQLFLSNFEAFEKVFYDAIYAEIQWRNVIPPSAVETDIPEGSVFASYGVKDWSGAGEFDQSLAGSMSTVGFNISKPVSIPIQPAQVSAIVSREDIRVYMHAYQGKLDTELAGIMKKAVERHVEGVFFYGNADLAFTAWLNNPEIPSASAFPSSGGPTEWDSKTPDEILWDINYYMTKVWDDSIQAHLPGEIYMPTKQFGDIATRRMGSGYNETQTTVLDYIKKKNLYTIQTNQELKVLSIPHLSGAGAGGTDRMFMLDPNPKYQKMPFPIPYRFLPPQEVNTSIILTAEYKFGPWHNRWPLSAIYVDEI